MHELGIIESALEAAIQEAHKARATAVHRLQVRVGELSGVVCESLEFAFDVLTKGTMAEGAILELERVLAQCHCPNCGLTFHPDGLFHQCPNCEHLETTLLAGEELELVAVEISTAEELDHEL